MSAHEYNTLEALQLLIRKIRDRDDSLAASLQAAIDDGKDVHETESGGRRKKKRVYRRRVALTHKEAADVAIKVLQSFFIELPCFIGSTSENFKGAAVGVPPQTGRHLPSWRYDEDQLVAEAEGLDKTLEIELRTETQILGEEQSTLSLKPIPLKLIDEQRTNLKRLAELMNTEE